MGKILHKYKNSVIIIKMNAVIRVFYFRAKQKAFIQIPASNASREAVFEGAQYMCRAVHTRLVISSQFPEEAGLHLVDTAHSAFGPSLQVSCTLH